MTSKQSQHPLPIPKWHTQDFYRNMFLNERRCVNSWATLFCEYHLQYQNEIANIGYYLKRNVYCILTYFKESNWCRTPSLRPVIWKAWWAWAHVIYSISKEDKNQVLGCEPRTEEPVPFFKQNGRTKWFSFPLTVLESALFRRCRRNTVVKYSDRVSCTTMHSNTATESAGDMLQRDQC